MGGVPFSKLSLKGQMKAHSYLDALLFPVRAFFFISVWDRAFPPVPLPPYVAVFATKLKPEK